jgi:large subunit ribosomal protein L10
MGGAYAGKALDANGVKALASIPSREVLISQIAGLLKSPIQRMAAVLGALAALRTVPAAEAAPAEPAAPAEAVAAAA